MNLHPEVETDRALDRPQAAGLRVVGDVGAPRRRVERGLRRELVDLFRVEPVGE